MAGVWGRCKPQSGPRVKGVGGSKPKLGVWLILKHWPFIFQTLFTELNYLFVSRKGSLSKKRGFSKIVTFFPYNPYIKNSPQNHQNMLILSIDMHFRTIFGFLPISILVYSGLFVISDQKGGSFIEIFIILDKIGQNLVRFGENRRI